MSSVQIDNDSCREIPNIKRLYWCYADEVDREALQYFRRNNLYRIEFIGFLGGAEPRLFNIDVTEWKWREEPADVLLADLFNTIIDGYVPKLNEWAESHFNKMVRRPVCVFVKDFDDQTWLIGGKSYKSFFKFSKAIDGRQGYSIKIINEASESSMIIADATYFPDAPEPPASGTCDPGVVNIYNTDANLLHSKSAPSGGAASQTIGDSIIENSDASYSQNILAEGTGVLPDTTYNIYDATATLITSVTFPTLKDEVINISL